ncbi:MAG: hypothetical protein B7Z54_09810, partial [Sphingobacteriales bacterium 12-47-4]
EDHEGWAKFALISILATGLLSLVSLFTSKHLALTRISKLVVLVLAIGSAGIMAQTAHLGGQIRHTEIRGAVGGQNDQLNGESGGAAEAGEEKDDD